MCTEMPHLRRTYLEMFGMWAVANNSDRKEEKAKEPLCEDLCVRYIEGLCCETDSGSRKLKRYSSIFCS